MLYHKPDIYAEALTLCCVFFSESTPLVIFVANHQGIRLLEVDGSHTNFSKPIPTNTSAVRIDLVYSKDEIVFQEYLDEKLYKYAKKCIYMCVMKQRAYIINL